MDEKRQSQRKTRVGIVVSDKMDKTVTVLVERLVQHPKYRKYVRRRKKFKAHDPQNLCREGDRVLIEETRPLSKTKRWRVVKILEREVKRGDVDLQEVQDLQG
ncbi:30S ribosomal protein S17 [Thermodesulforhabdus norvegica]|uniref:Small ribosomal subunit protein uS17 n=1 Tax=Thermodesulforhabdus norvegica TaxID=39841 RepID=A0A1I4VNB5_9BACT|nr:30S ribosomal protein S17 [Thermodesulforhabdus norvegica]SFN02585.1 small subunit ribosomal protein S17 [Thermodesulforhabdus norvegica]